MQMSLTTTNYIVARLHCYTILFLIQKVFLHTLNKYNNGKEKSRFFTFIILTLHKVIHPN